MKVTINEAVQFGAWYAGSPGVVFDVREVKVPFKGHQYKHTVYEVLNGSNEGDFILPADCKTVNQ